MRKRAHISKPKSKRKFRNASGSKSINKRARPMRGGFRI